MTKQENANAVPEVPIGEFPPYGFYNESDVENLKKQPLFPRDWDGDEASWDAWFQDTLRLINDLLWPEFVPGVAKWRGKSVSNMGALTDADLDILVSIQNSVPLELDRYVQTPACPVGSYTTKICTFWKTEVSRIGAPITPPLMTRKRRISRRP